MLSKDQNDDFDDKVAHIIIKIELIALIGVL